MVARPTPCSHQLEPIEDVVPASSEKDLAEIATLLANRDLNKVSARWRATAEHELDTVDGTKSLGSWDWKQLYD